MFWKAVNECGETKEWLEEFRDSDQRRQYPVQVQDIPTSKELSHLKY